MNKTGIGCAMFFIFAAVIIGLLITVGTIVLTVHGLILAFSASFVMGLIALIVEPSPLVFSLIYIAYGYNIPQHLVEYFNK